MLVDRFSAAGPHTASWMFHFAEGWSEPRIESGRAVLEQDEAILEVLWDASQAKASALRTPFYPTYGNRHERWALRCEVAFSDSCRVRFTCRIHPRGQHS